MLLRLLSKELPVQGATINKMGCGKIRKDLARHPRLNGCVCASITWVAEY